MKNIIKNILSVGALILLAAVIYAMSSTEFVKTAVHKTRPHNMVYFKDETTGLCFVYAAGVANVPCTAEVEQAIKEGQ